MVLIALHPSFFLERAQVDRNASARDVQPPGDVRDARPPAVGGTDFMDREQMVSGTVGEFVGFELFPSLHVFDISNTWMVRQSNLNRGGVRRGSDGGQTGVRRGSDPGLT